MSGHGSKLPEGADRYCAQLGAEGESRCAGVQDYAEKEVVADLGAELPESVLSALAGADVLRRFDDELDAAFERSRLDGDLGPLLETVRRWWFEADAWRDPAAQREFLARVDGYLADGPPPADRRVTRQEVRARFGV